MVSALKIAFGARHFSQLFPEQSMISLPVLFPLKLASLPTNSIVKMISCFRPLSSHQPDETYIESPGALIKMCVCVRT